MQITDVLFVEREPEKSLDSRGLCPYKKQMHFAVKSKQNL